VTRQSPPTTVTLSEFVLPRPILSGAGNLTVTLIGAVETRGPGPNQTDTVELWDEDFGPDDRLESRTVTITHPNGAWPGLLIPYSVTVTLSLDGNGNVRGTLNSSGETRPQLYQYLIEEDRNTSSATVQGGVPLLAEGFDANRILAPADFRPFESETSGVSQIASREYFVSVLDPQSLLELEKLTRLQDALNVFNAALGNVGVRLTWVEPDTPADILVRIGATSPCGNKASGVLGCTSDNGLITILEGWNWYAGADPALIARDQYDFQTVVTHELGHALGIDHTHNAQSAMFGTLVLGSTRRSLGVVADEVRGSTAHDATSAGGICPLCGSSHTGHETPNDLSYEPGDRTQRVPVVDSDKLHLGESPAARQFVEFVVFAIPHRPVEEQFTVEGGSDRDILTGGDGAELQFGEPGRDMLLGGFASNAPDQVIGEAASPMAGITTDLADAALNDLLV
jgi:hypothetical protein